jgi:tRNA nucleotidyltransferase (CCA-adding enzyme)
MEMFAVGGWVRDRIMGVESNDMDFTVVGGSFDDMRAHLLQEGFQIFLESPEYLTIRARFSNSSEWLQHVPGLKLPTADFVLARQEGAYSDGRRPDLVRPGTLLDDLKRRDFTVNAIAMNVDGFYIDPFHGQRDIEHNLLTCVGHVDDRFTEDSLRALRAIRFHLTRGFSLGVTIREALQSDWVPPLLESVSVERKREEMLKCFKHDTLATMEFLSTKTSREFRAAVFGDGLWLQPSLKQ